MNSLSEHAALREFINIHWIYAFPDELAKGTYRAMRVHLVRMNFHPPVEIPVAKRVM